MKNLKKVVLFAMVGMMFLGCIFPVTAKAEDREYSIIKNVKLNIISPERKTVKVRNLPSSIHVYVMGGIVKCWNTQHVLLELVKQSEEMGFDIYYLDIKEQDAESIIEKAQELQIEEDCYLCVDRDKAYNRIAWSYVKDGLSWVMPMVVVTGKNNETIYANSFHGDGLDDFIQEIEDAISAKYPKQESRLPQDAQQGTWNMVDGDWFCLDSNGNKLLGWCLDAEGNYYFLNPLPDGNLGKMQTGWVWVADKSGVQRCYYFNPNPDGYCGKMMMNTVIDGYTLEIQPSIMT